MIRKGVSSFPLTAIWKRLESVCQRLWDENSSGAVQMQAVLEEFKGEVHRVEAHLDGIGEAQAHAAKSDEETQAAVRRQYEMELANFKKRLELQESALRDKDARTEDLIKTIARKEEEALDFRSQILRASVIDDEAKAGKMEVFYQKLMKAEAALTESWQKRHATLEHEHQELQRILVAWQSEMDVWERRCVGDKESLQNRNTELEIKTQRLAQQYREKRQEIEDLKAGLERNIAELVSRYQSRLRGSNALPSAPPASSASRSD
jgi:chromosome segregation ATPase